MRWRNHLRADPLGWLLAADSPAVRAATLQRLGDRPADAPEVRAARAAAMTVDPIRSILAAQQPAGWWAKPRPVYGPSTAAPSGSGWTPTATSRSSSRHPATKETWRRGEAA